MDYKNKYREALERAKKLYEQGTITESLNYVFPELKESRDERIRKALIEYFNEQCDMSDWNGVYGYQVVAWLEKQGEQKLVDKVEPKFHEGDWIIHRGTENVYQVVACIDSQYQLRYGNNYTIQKCNEVDRNARLWTIKDASWSEEDEQNLQGIIDELKANKLEAPEYDHKTYDRFLVWIKSIKQRIGG